MSGRGHRQRVGKNRKKAPQASSKHQTEPSQSLAQADIKNEPQSSPHQVLDEPSSSLAPSNEYASGQPSSSSLQSSQTLEQQRLLFSANSQPQYPSDHASGSQSPPQRRMGAQRPGSTIPHSSTGTSGFQSGPFDPSTRRGHLKSTPTAPNPSMPGVMSGTTPLGHYPVKNTLAEQTMTGLNAPPLGKKTVEQYGQPTNQLSQAKHGNQHQSFQPQTAHQAHQHNHEHVHSCSYPHLEPTEDVVSIEMLLRFKTNTLTHQDLEYLANALFPSDAAFYQKRTCAAMSASHPGLYTGEISTSSDATPQTTKEHGSHGTNTAQSNKAITTSGGSSGASLSQTQAKLSRETPVSQALQQRQPRTKGKPLSTAETHQLSAELEKKMRLYVIEVRRLQYLEAFTAYLHHQCTRIPRELRVFLPFNTGYPTHLLFSPQSTEYQHGIYSSKFPIFPLDHVSRFNYQPAFHGFLQQGFPIHLIQHTNAIPFLPPLLQQADPSTTSSSHSYSEQTAIDPTLDPPFSTFPVNLYAFVSVHQDPDLPPHPIVQSFTHNYPDKESFMLEVYKRPSTQQGTQNKRIFRPASYYDPRVKRPSHSTNFKSSTRSYSDAQPTTSSQMEMEPSPLHEMNLYPLLRSSHPDMLFYDTPVKSQTSSNGAGSSSRAAITQQVHFIRGVSHMLPYLDEIQIHPPKPVHVFEDPYAVCAGRPRSMAPVQPEQQLVSQRPFTHPPIPSTMDQLVTLDLNCGYISLLHVLSSEVRRYRLMATRPCLVPTAYVQFSPHETPYLAVTPPQTCVLVFGGHPLLLNIGTLLRLAPSRVDQRDALRNERKYRHMLQTLGKNDYYPPVDPDSDEYEPPLSPQPTILDTYVYRLYDRFGGSRPGYRQSTPLNAYLSQCARMPKILRYIMWYGRSSPDPQPFTASFYTRKRGRKGSQFSKKSPRSKHTRRCRYRDQDLISRVFPQHFAQRLHHIKRRYTSKRVMKNTNQQQHRRLGGLVTPPIETGKLLLQEDIGYPIIPASHPWLCSFKSFYTYLINLSEVWLVSFTLSTETAVGDFYRFFTTPLHRTIFERDYKTHLSEFRIRQRRLYVEKLKTFINDELSRYVRALQHIIRQIRLLSSWNRFPRVPVTNRRLTPPHSPVGESIPSPNGFSLHSHDQEEEPDRQTVDVKDDPQHGGNIDQDDNLATHQSTAPTASRQALETALDYHFLPDMNTGLNLTPDEISEYGSQYTPRCSLTPVRHPLPSMTNVVHDLLSAAVLVSSAILPSKKDLSTIESNTVPFYQNDHLQHALTNYIESVPELLGNSPLRPFKRTNTHRNDMNVNLGIDMIEQYLTYSGPAATTRDQLPSSSLKHLQPEAGLTIGNSVDFTSDKTIVVNNAGNDTKNDDEELKRHDLQERCVRHDLSVTSSRAHPLITSTVLSQYSPYITPPQQQRLLKDYPLSERPFILLQHRYTQSVYSIRDYFFPHSKGVYIPYIHPAALLLPVYPSFVDEDEDDVDDISDHQPMESTKDDDASQISHSNAEKSLASKYAVGTTSAPPTVSMGTGSQFTVPACPYVTFKRKDGSVFGYTPLTHHHLALPYFGPLSNARYRTLPLNFSPKILLDPSLYPFPDNTAEHLVTEYRQHPSAGPPLSAEDALTLSLLRLARPSLTRYTADITFPSNGDATRNKTPQGTSQYRRIYESFKPHITETPYYAYLRSIDKGQTNQFLYFNLFHQELHENVHEYAQLALEDHLQNFTHIASPSDPYTSASRLVLEDYKKSKKRRLEHEAALKCERDEHVKCDGESGVNESGANESDAAQEQEADQTAESIADGVNGKPLQKPENLDSVDVYQQQPPPARRTNASIICSYGQSLDPQDMLLSAYGEEFSDDEPDLEQKCSELHFGPVPSSVPHVLEHQRYKFTHLFYSQSAMAYDLVPSPYSPTFPVLLPYQGDAIINLSTRQQRIDYYKGQQYCHHEYNNAYVDYDTTTVSSAATVPRIYTFGSCVPKQCSLVRSSSRYPATLSPSLPFDSTYSYFLEYESHFTPHVLSIFAQIGRQRRFTRRKRLSTYVTQPIRRALTLPLNGAVLTLRFPTQPTPFNTIPVRPPTFNSFLQRFMYDSNIRKGDEISTDAGTVGVNGSNTPSTILQQVPLIYFHATELERRLGVACCRLLSPQTQFLHVLSSSLSNRVQPLLHRKASVSDQTVQPLALPEVLHSIEDRALPPPSQAISIVGDSNTPSTTVDHTEHALPALPDALYIKTDFSSKEEIIGLESPPDIDTLPPPPPPPLPLTPVSCDASCEESQIGSLPGLTDVLAALGDADIPTVIKNPNIDVSQLTHLQIEHIKVHTHPLYHLDKRFASVLDQLHRIFISTVLRFFPYLLQIIIDAVTTDYIRLQSRFLPDEFTAYANGYQDAIDIVFGEDDHITSARKYTQSIYRTVPDECDLQTDDPLLLRESYEHPNRTGLSDVAFLNQLPYNPQSLSETSDSIISKANFYRTTFGATVQTKVSPEIVHSIYQLFLLLPLTVRRELKYILGEVILLALSFNIPWIGLDDLNSILAAYNCQWIDISPYFPKQQGPFQNSNPPPTRAEQPSSPGSDTTTTAGVETQYQNPPPALAPEPNSLLGLAQILPTDSSMIVLFDFLAYTLLDEFSMIPSPLRHYGLPESDMLLDFFTYNGQSRQQQIVRLPAQSRFPPIVASHQSSDIFIPAYHVSESDKRPDVIITADPYASPQQFSEQYNPHPDSYDSYDGEQPKIRVLPARIGTALHVDYNTQSFLYTFYKHHTSGALGEVLGGMYSSILSIERDRAVLRGDGLAIIDMEHFLVDHRNYSAEHETIFRICRKIDEHFMGLVALRTQQVVSPLVNEAYQYIDQILQHDAASSQNVIPDTRNIPIDEQVAPNSSSPTSNLDQNTKGDGTSSTILPTKPRADHSASIDGVTPALPCTPPAATHNPALSPVDPTDPLGLRALANLSPSASVYESPLQRTLAGLLSTERALLHSGLATPDSAPYSAPSFSYLSLSKFGYSLPLVGTPIPASGTKNDNHESNPESESTSVGINQPPKDLALQDQLELFTKSEATLQRLNTINSDLLWHAERIMRSCQLNPRHPMLIFHLEDMNRIPGHQVCTQSSFVRTRKQYQDETYAYMGYNANQAATPHGPQGNHSGPSQTTTNTNPNSGDNPKDTTHGVKLFNGVRMVHVDPNEINLAHLVSAYHAFHQATLLTASPQPPLLPGTTKPLYCRTLSGSSNILHMVPVKPIAVTAIPADMEQLYNKIILYRYYLLQFKQYHAMKQRRSLPYYIPIEHTPATLTRAMLSYGHRIRRYSLPMPDRYRSQTLHNMTIDTQNTQNTTPHDYCLTSIGSAAQKQQQQKQSQQQRSSRLDSSFTLPIQYAGPVPTPTFLRNEAILQAIRDLKAEATNHFSKQQFAQALHAYLIILAKLSELQYELDEDHHGGVFIHDIPELLQVPGYCSKIIQPTWDHQLLAAINNYHVPPTTMPDIIGYIRTSLQLLIQNNLALCHVRLNNTISGLKTITAAKKEFDPFIITILTSLPLFSSAICPFCLHRQLNPHLYPFMIHGSGACTILGILSHAFAITKQHHMFGLYVAHNQGRIDHNRGHSDGAYDFTPHVNYQSSAHIDELNSTHLLDNVQNVFVATSTQAYTFFELSLHLNEQLTPQPALFKNHHELKCPEHPTDLRYLHPSLAMSPHNLFRSLDTLHPKYDSNDPVNIGELYHPVMVTHVLQRTARDVDSLAQYPTIFKHTLPDYNYSHHPINFPCPLPPMAAAATQHHHCSYSPTPPYTVCSCSRKLTTFNNQLFTRMLLPFHRDDRYQTYTSLPLHRLSERLLGLIPSQALFDAWAHAERGPKKPISACPIAKHYHPHFPFFQKLGLKDGRTHSPCDVSSEIMSVVFSPDISGRYDSYTKTFYRETELRIAAQQYGESMEVIHSALLFIDNLIFLYMNFVYTCEYYQSEAVALYAYGIPHPVNIDLRRLLSARDGYFKLLKKCQNIKNEEESPLTQSFRRKLARTVVANPTGTTPRLTPILRPPAQQTPSTGNSTDGVQQPFVIPTQMGVISTAGAPTNRS